MTSFAGRPIIEAGPETCSRSLEAHLIQYLTDPCCTGQVRLTAEAPFISSASPAFKQQETSHSIQESSDCHLLRPPYFAIASRTKSQSNLDVTSFPSVSYANILPLRLSHLAQRKLSRRLLKSFPLAPPEPKDLLHWSSPVQKVDQPSCAENERKSNI
jgi:hypothetical protein